MTHANSFSYEGGYVDLEDFPAWVSELMEDAALDHQGGRKGEFRTAKMTFPKCAGSQFGIAFEKPMEIETGINILVRRAAHWIWEFFNQKGEPLPC